MYTPDQINAMSLKVALATLRRLAFDTLQHIIAEGTPAMKLKASKWIINHTDPDRSPRFSREDARQVGKLKLEHEAQQAAATPQQVQQPNLDTCDEATGQPTTTPTAREVRVENGKEVVYINGYRLR